MKPKININQLLNLPVYSYEKYHQKSKIKLLSKDNLDPKKWPKEWKEIYYKSYGRLKEIILPRPSKINISLLKALLKRESIRNFLPESLSTKKLSTLLYFSAGLKKKSETRFYPSAGARYPLEIYILSLNTDLSRGLYHYYVRNHSLEVLNSFKTVKLNKIFNQPWIFKAGAIVIITALFNRAAIKYRERGYRYILSETGHLGQNIYLLSSALDIGCCAIGGYLDDKLNELLDIDGLNESVIYVLALGTH